MAFAISLTTSIIRLRNLKVSGPNEPVQDEVFSEE
jgi:hypothetical protein